MYKDGNLLSSWNRVKSRIRGELGEGYDNLFNGIDLLGITESGNLSFVVSNGAYFTEEGSRNGVRNLLREFWKDELGRALDVEISDGSLASSEERLVAKQQLSGRICRDLNIRQDYTFDNFIVGESNMVPYNLCHEIAKGEKDVANLLYIYGGVGLGKTHLLHAIMNEARGRDDVCLYISSEEFMNRFVKSILNQKTHEFKEYIRSSQVLLVDDIQFLLHKKKTQEEFYHSFKCLLDSGKRVIITSDRASRDMAVEEESLRSCFLQGVEIEINKPNKSMRLEVVKEKCKKIGLALSKEVSELIASRIKNSVRELEGALNTLENHARLHRKEIDVEFTWQVLSGALTSASQDGILSVSHIIGAVSDFYSISKEDILSKKRSKKISYVRKVAMYLSKKHTSSALVSIGKEFGRKDHSCVIYAVRKVEASIDEDTRLQGEVRKIEDSLKKFT